MKSSFKVGDLVKTNIKYLREVLAETHNPSSTTLQTTQALGMLAEQTATIIGISYITMDGGLYHILHIMPTLQTNSLFRGGRGSKIYFENDAQATSALVKVN